MFRIIKRIIYVFAFLFAIEISAQESFITVKVTTKSLGIRVGVPVFNNLVPIANGWFTLLPKDYLTESSLVLKLQKHELSTGIFICMNPSKKFVPGESASYIYHFNKNRIHPFLEINGNYLRYTTACDGSPMPYDQNTQWPINGSGFSDAKIKSIVANAAVGVEASIWKIIFCQFAIGEGYYMVNAQSGKQSSTPRPNLDPYYLFGMYGKHNGSNWYARLSLVFRLHHF